MLEDEKRQEIQGASRDSLSASHVEGSADRRCLQDTGLVDMRKLWDEIADDMWKDYCNYVLARKRR